MNRNFKEENDEVGCYLATARNAQREGFPEIAEVEDNCTGGSLARRPFCQTLSTTSTKGNLKEAIAGETMSNKIKKSSWCC